MSRHGSWVACLLTVTSTVHTHIHTYIHTYIRFIPTEKYYFSNEDLLLYDVNGRKDVVTEQMVTYPLIDLTGGDFKKDPLDKYSIFRQNYPEGHAAIPYLDMAVEICLGK